jgi:hypothetical protein
MILKGRYYTCESVLIVIDEVQQTQHRRPYSEIRK